MKKYRIYIYITSVFLLSCSSPKQNYLTEFGDFINKVELENSSYSDDDWKYIEVEFNDFSVIQYMEIENELSEAEKNQIDSYNNRYKKLRIKNDPTGKILEILGID